MRMPLDPKSPQEVKVAVGSKVYKTQATTDVTGAVDFDFSEEALVARRREYERREREQEERYRREMDEIVRQDYLDRAAESEAALKERLSRVKPAPKRVLDDGGYVESRRVGDVLEICLYDKTGYLMAVWTALAEQGVCVEFLDPITNLPERFWILPNDKVERIPPVKIDFQAPEPQTPQKPRRAQGPGKPPVPATPAPRQDPLPNRPRRIDLGPG